MIERLGFYSQALVEATKFDPSFAIISITNPASEAKIIGTDNILRLEFLDLDLKDVDYEMIKEGIAFNQQHATDIIEFVEEISKKPQINTLVVHCYAGVSRSSAVSLGIYHYLKENNLLADKFDFPSHMQTHYANTLVTSTFKKFLREDIYVPTKAEAQRAMEDVLVYIPKMFKPL